MKKAVILLSGGLDSATCLAVAVREGFECVALSFDYGQRHHCELEAARRVAESLGAVRHHVLKLDLRLWGGSALTSNDLAVPDFGTHGSDIPVTYVPARNLMFLSCAAACAEAENARDLFIGVNSVDYSGYPDCRPEFIRAFAEAARLGTKACDEGWKFEIHAPLQYLAKAEIIRLGTGLGVDYSLTHSCYNPTPEGLACGRCDSCKLRQAGFADAGIPDPTRYGEQI
ncbi:MAG: 7-cyano-7-deazaguanine synthase QueC [Victivallaceae bacterium]|nr:7-cyano-7-deazaguanine synthase QueC [Victivallaceae bacterium]